MVQIRLVKEQSFYSERSVNTPDDAVEIFAKEIQNYDREVMCVINCTSKMRPINMSIVSMGDIAGTLVTPREVFKTAILSNASMMVLMHNHPSGVPTPSVDDIVVTHKLQLLGEMMGINVMDHIIVAGGTGSRYSMLEHGELKGQTKGVFTEVEKIIKKNKVL